MKYNYQEWLKNPIKLFCRCECGQEIIIQKWYKYHDIPEYIKGHYWNNKNRSEETK